MNPHDAHAPLAEYRPESPFFQDTVELRSVEYDSNSVGCDEHDGTGWPCPTCDICMRSMCLSQALAWNGETGNHVFCERVGLTTD